MYPTSSIITLLLTTILTTSTHALPPTLNPNPNPNPNNLLLPTNPSSPSSAPQKNTTANTTPLTFLGVDCYHLDPDRDALPREMCETLFAYLVSGGDVYRQHRYWNGMRFKRPYEPCMITLSSPLRTDRDVAISFAQLIQRAIAVLRECKMGGEDVFEGQWRVVVTKGVVPRALGRVGLRRGG